MPECGCLIPDRPVSEDVDLAESIVMQAYVQLPLLPRQPDGCWVASLKRCGNGELRLVESVPASPGQPVLRVELLDRVTNTVIESQDCEEIEQAVMAFKAMLPATWS
jgi:hypothetical protein